MKSSCSPQIMPLRVSVWFIIASVFVQLASQAEAPAWVEQIVEGGKIGNGYSHGEFPSEGNQTHPGIDIGGGCGLPVKAAADGEIVRIVSKPASLVGITDQSLDEICAQEGNGDAVRDYCSLGNAAVIQHRDEPDGRPTYTLYLHMAKTPEVQPGPVSRGDIIGFTGETGFAKGCHLHFEVRHFLGTRSVYHPTIGRIYVPGDHSEPGGLEPDWSDPEQWFTQQAASFGETLTSDADVLGMLKQGIWTGEVDQPSSRSSYSIDLRAESGTVYVYYPEFSCGGVWELIEDGGTLAKFRERLQGERGRCVNNGYVELSTLSDGRLSFQYRFTSKGSIVASAILSSDLHGHEFQTDQSNSLWTLTEQESFTLARGEARSGFAVTEHGMATYKGAPIGTIPAAERLRLRVYHSPKRDYQLAILADIGFEGLFGYVIDETGPSPVIWQAFSMDDIAKYGFTGAVAWSPDGTAFGLALAQWEALDSLLVVDADARVRGLYDPLGINQSVTQARAQIEAASRNGFSWGPQLDRITDSDSGIQISFDVYTCDWDTYDCEPHSLTGKSFDVSPQASAKILSKVGSDYTATWTHSEAPDMILAAGDSRGDFEFTRDGKLFAGGKLIHEVTAFPVSDYHMEIFYSPQKTRYTAIEVGDHRGSWGFLADAKTHARIHLATLDSGASAPIFMTGDPSVAWSSDDRLLSFARNFENEFKNDLALVRTRDGLSARFQSEIVKWDSCLNSGQAGIRPILGSLIQDRARLLATFKKSLTPYSEPGCSATMNGSILGADFRLPNEFAAGLGVGDSIAAEVDSTSFRDRAQALAARIGSAKSAEREAMIVVTENILTVLEVGPLAQRMSEFGLTPGTVSGIVEARLEDAFRDSAKDLTIGIAWDLGSEILAESFATIMMDSQFAEALPENLKSPMRALLAATVSEGMGLTKAIVIDGGTVGPLAVVFPVLDRIEDAREIYVESNAVAEARVGVLLGAALGAEINAEMNARYRGPGADSIIDDWMDQTLENLESISTVEDYLELREILEIGSRGLRWQKLGYTDDSGMAEVRALIGLRTQSGRGTNSGWNFIDGLVKLVSGYNPREELIDAFLKTTSLAEFVPDAEVTLGDWKDVPVPNVKLRPGESYNGFRLTENGQPFLDGRLLSSITDADAVELHLYFSPSRNFTFAMMRDRDKGGLTAGYRSRFQPFTRLDVFVENWQERDETKHCAFLHDGVAWSPDEDMIAFKCLQREGGADAGFFNIRSGESYLYRPGWAERSHRDTVPRDGGRWVVWGPDFRTLNLHSNGDISVDFERYRCKDSVGGGDCWGGWEAEPYITTDRFDLPW